MRLQNGTTNIAQPHRDGLGGKMHIDSDVVMHAGGWHPFSTCVMGTMCSVGFILGACKGCGGSAKHKIGHL